MNVLRKGLASRSLRPWPGRGFCSWGVFPRGAPGGPVFAGPGVAVSRLCVRGVSVFVIAVFSMPWLVAGVETTGERNGIRGGGVSSDSVFGDALCLLQRSSSFGAKPEFSGCRSRCRQTIFVAVTSSRGDSSRARARGRNRNARKRVVEPGLRQRERQERQQSIPTRVQSIPTLGKSVFVQATHDGTAVAGKGKTDTERVQIRVAGPFDASRGVSKGSTGWVTGMSRSLDRSGIRDADGAFFTGAFFTSAFLTSDPKTTGRALTVTGAPQSQVRFDRTLGVAGLRAEIVGASGPGVAVVPGAGSLRQGHRMVLRLRATP